MVSLQVHQLDVPENLDPAMSDFIANSHRIPTHDSNSVEFLGRIYRVRERPPSLGNISQRRRRVGKFIYCQ